MSRTRQMVADLRRQIAASAPGGGLARNLVPLPAVVAPPARVYVPSRPVVGGAGQGAARHTTALVGIGHVGTRYATDVVLQFQAELAVAHAAVATELPATWPAAHGFVGLQTQCESHREYLLRPDKGRRLDAASLARLATVKHDIDVQLILADGLSASAAMASGPQLFAATLQACQARGLSVGTPLCAKFARVWLEDEIGAAVGAKVAFILLGERPGLGTGDGLSAYGVYQPKLGNTDGERNMLSNIHARGTPVLQAAERIATLATAMLAQRKSGVHLDLATVGGASERGYRPPQVRERLVVRDA